MLRSPVGRAAVESAIAGAGTAEGTLRERLPEAAVGGTVGTVLGAAGQRVSKPVANLLRGRARGQAGEALAETVAQEGTDLTALAGRMRPGQMLPEVTETGGPVQALTKQVTAGQEPGSRRLRGTLQQRMRGVPGEVSELLEERTGFQAEDVFRTAEQMTRTKKAAARPFYEAALARGTVDDPRIRQLIQDKPSLQRAYQRAEQTAAEEGIALAPLDNPDVRTLHIMKEELDDLIRRADRSAETSAPSARQLRAMTQTKNELLELLEENVPEYRAGRLQYAGDAAVEDVFEAAREGSKRLDLKRFLQEDPRRIQRALGEMTPSEQEFYRRSALDVVQNLSPKKRMAFVFNDDPQVQRKLRLLFDSDAEFEAFRNALAGPEARFRLGRVAGRTGQAPAGGVAEPGAAERVRQFTTGAAMTPFFSLSGRLRMISALAPGAGLSPAAASELGDLLASTTPETFEELVRLLSQRQRIRTGLPATAAAGLTLEGGGRIGEP